MCIRDRLGGVVGGGGGGGGGGRKLKAADSMLPSFSELSDFDMSCLKSILGMEGT